MDAGVAVGVGVTVGVGSIVGVGVGVGVGSIVGVGVGVGVGSIVGVGVTVGVGSIVGVGVMVGVGVTVGVGVGMDEESKCAHRTGRMPEFSNGKSVPKPLILIIPKEVTDALKLDALPGDLSRHVKGVPESS